MDYNTLTDQIIAYANREGSEEFAKAIPYFIENAQQKIWKELKTIGFQAIFSQKFQKDNAYINLPGDWQETISISYEINTSDLIKTTVLFPRSYEFCINYWPTSSNSNSDNLPLFYAEVEPEIVENNKPYRMFISPTPNQDYQYQLTYVQRPPIFDKDHNKTILTDYYPDLLFYAAFLEALIYLKDDQRMPVYTKLYQESLTAANNLTKDRYIDRSVKRDVG